MCWIIAATIIATLVFFVILMLPAKSSSPLPLPPPPPESAIDFYLPQEPLVPKNLRGGSPTQCEPISKPMSSALPFANVPMAYAREKPI